MNLPVDFSSEQFSRNFVNHFVEKEADAGDDGTKYCTCQGERSKHTDGTIGQSAFAAYDTLLYMDTHPQDQEAMAYYHKQAGIRREAMEEYARRFGPLTMDLIDETDCHSWEWMMQPWPWERSGKGRC